ncbi:Hypothetical predicted protein [Cloeon dipterum]|uniref:Gustatory receptor n=1 Tax=Cloeon dipterum TaxID=197152 RepID=A0A8S1BYD7_9INSE|nr:Hypothetical predicted protein [Cloeon dipterum]
MYRFSKFFLKSWRDHDKRESTLNLTNVLILSANFVAGMAIPYTTLINPERVNLILRNMQKQAGLLSFDQSPGYRGLRRRVWVKSVGSFAFMNFLFVYEPFLWPDYFLLLDLIGRLWSSVAIALVEVQVVCICDSFKQTFLLLNTHLSANGANVNTLRKVHDNLSDCLSHFQDHYGLFILSNVLYLFCSVTFGLYFSIIGMFQNLPNWEIVVKQAAVSNSWLLYAIYRTVNLTWLCGESLQEAKRTGVILCKLLHLPLKCERKREVIQFLQQLSHRSHKFRATGVLRMDNAMLLEVCIVEFVIRT